MPPAYRFLDRWVALIRRLTPMLRPLFRSNHTWAMRHGERQIRQYLDAK